VVQVATSRDIESDKGNRDDRGSAMWARERTTVFCSSARWVPWCGPQTVAPTVSEVNGGLQVGSRAAIRVFYSWQSDLPNGVTRGFVLNCLKAAKTKLESAPGPVSAILIDEATRDTTGAPHIPETILKKMDSADVLVADVSIINGTVKEDEGRRTPNPNVMLELGFGVGRLGWERIIPVFNQAFGEFPRHLPFDLERRRVTPFQLSESDDAKAKETVKNKLTATLRGAIEAVAAKNPPRPWDEWAATEKRGRDVRALTNLCSEVDLGIIQSQCENARRGFVSDAVLYYFDRFHAVLADVEFHLHDSETAKLAAELQKSWEQAIPDARFTDEVRNGYKFKPRDAVMNRDEKKAWTRLQNGARMLSKALPAFVKHIQQNYLEVDLVETSRKARARRAKA
jgi:hypothetical protein